jgi:hypothetical protein
MLSLGLAATAAWGDDTPVPSSMDVSRAMAAADRLAFSWQPDAVLVSVYVKAAADGNLDLSHLAGRDNPVGDLLTLSYASAKANRKATIALDRSANPILVGTPVAIPAGQRVLPIRGPFLDLRPALAKIRQMGINLPASRRDGYIEACLSAIADRPGGPSRYVWAITRVDLSGPVAVANPPIEVHAGAGPMAAQGREASAGVPSLADELRQGKEFPADVPLNFASFRREADAWAARWTGDLKLAEVDLTGSYSGQRFRLQSALFRYFRPNPRAETTNPWLLTSVLIDDRQVKVDSLDRPSNDPVLRPQAVPNNISPPEEVLPKFAALNVDAPPEQVYLRLSCLGGDRWLWRMAAVRQGAVTSGAVTAVPSVDFVYLDARSGKFLADSEAGLLAALASPTSPSASVAIDPALVGTWQVFTPTPQGKRRITFEIRPTGTYTLAIAGSGNVPTPESGLLRAGDGMWMEMMSNGQTDQGKYSVPDPETLVLTTQQGQSLTWKRASPTQPEGRANAAVAGKPASASPQANTAVRPR